MYWVLLGSFLFGAVGALLIVWLRWTGTLRRFSSSVEIEIIEEEYKDVSAYITSKIKEGKEINEPEIHHSDNLRDDIWRQRTKSFLTSALLYVILGGFTAVIYIGLEVENILDPLIIAKLVTAGALWTTFYSFIDVKKADELIKDLEDEKDEESLTKIEELRKKFEEKILLEREKANKIIRELVEKYNEAVKK